jgi:two-component system LytT family response regulator
MYKAIIIDDEEMARTLLQGMVAEYCNNVETVDLCKDLPTGVKAIRKHKPDIVFLDIEMPGHSGLELLDFFDENEINFSIIFVTAYNRYAIQAFKLSAVDYLLKPIEVDDLKNAMILFERNKNRNKATYSVLKENFKKLFSKKNCTKHT